MHPLNKPEVLVGVAQEKLDNTGKLTDDKTKEIIKSMLVNLVILVKRLKQK
jgi:hypothetical protein